MNRQFLMMTLSLLIAGSVVLKSQTSLAGRTYYNANILADKMGEATKDIDKEIAKTKAEGMAKFEKKKGRKMTAEEEAKFDEEIKKTTKQIDAVKNGMKMSITIEFEDSKNLVMRQNTKVSDEAMKVAGIGWLKRKALKVTLAVGPQSAKSTYVVKDNMVILTAEDKEKDTMYVSQDGKYLTGVIDKNIKFKLTRTK